MSWGLQPCDFWGCPGPPAPGAGTPPGHLGVVTWQTPVPLCPTLCHSKRSSCTEVLRGNPAVEVLPRAAGSLSTPNSDQLSWVHGCPQGDLGENSMGLTFLPEPLQPHSQFVSMFRYQFRGPLGGADWEIKRGKLLVDVCATDPTSNQLSVEPVFPGRAKILAGGREHSPGVTP